MREVKTATATATSGLKMECVTAHHEFVISGAPTMGGNGRGVDPAETLIAALGACALVIAKSFAPLKGIDLTSISVDVVGEFDDYGFEFLQQEVKSSRVGYSRISSTYRIESKNSAEEVEEFIRFVEGNCPVRDTLEAAPEFATSVVHTAAAAS